MSQNVDWHFWMGMGTVKLWQGCALVTGLNPDTLRWDLRKRVAGPGSGPLFEGRSFPSAEAKAKFERALRLADNSTSYMNGPIYPQGPLRSEQPGSSKAKKEVLLSEVVAFFVSCEWPEIPEALQSLASQPVETPAPVMNEQALSVSNSQLSNHQTPENIATTTADSQDQRQKGTATGPRLSTTRAALITQHKHEWPTIEGDIKGASENGLSKVAKAGLRDWDEDLAMEWARSRNKLIKPASTATLTTAMNKLPSKKYRMEG